jgi:hypothetical protein
MQASVVHDSVALSSGLAQQLAALGVGKGWLSLVHDLMVKRLHVLQRAARLVNLMSVCG